MREKDRIAKLAKETTLNYGEFLASKERTLKTNAKVAGNRKLYLDGLSKGLQGVPFDSFTDLIEYNGEMIQRKKHPGFKAGYNEGLKRSAMLEKNDNKKTR